jgi:hypothetical protein
MTQYDILVGHCQDIYKLYIIHCKHLQKLSKNPDNFIPPDYILKYLLRALLLVSNKTLSDYTQRINFAIKTKIELQKIVIPEL